MSNVNDFHYYSQGQGGCKLMGRRSCALCTELEEIESLRAELAQKSSQLCVKINRSHSAIFRLPPEIIATIFEAYLYGSSYAEFLYQPQDPMKFPPPDCTPFLLGAVCKVWRDVAWSTPSLWASITIHVDFRHVEQPVQTLLTKEWLSRSGKLPLSIRLLDDLPSRNNDIFQIRPLIAVINQYSPRWRHLHLDLPICLFPFFRPLGDQAPILEYMRIEGQDHFLNDHPANERNANTLRLGAAPRLKCVSIHRITLRLVDIPWENITRFLGEQSSVSECLQILRRAPLLEHCVFQRSSGLTHGYPIFAPPILARHLQTLYILLPIQNSHIIFNNITSPSLNELSLTGSIPSCEALITFLARSHCSLRCLSLSYFAAPDAELICLLRSQPSLTALALRWSLSLSRRLLSAIATTQNGQLSSGSEGPFLPLLECLEFVGVMSDFSWEHFAEIFPSFSQEQAAGLLHADALPTFDSQKPSHSLRCVLVTFAHNTVHAVNHPEVPYIPESVLPRLLHALEGGVDLKINVTYNGTDAKDWLKLSQEFHQVHNDHLLTGN